MLKAITSYGEGCLLCRGVLWGRVWSEAGKQARWAWGGFGGLMLVLAGLFLWDWGRMCDACVQSVGVWWWCMGCTG